jgi:hypothetical protein
MVHAEKLILPEIAARYDRKPNTIRTRWMRDPAWPEPAGRRGRWNEYDAAAVARAVELIAGRRRLAGGGPDELLDVPAAARYTGLAAATIRSDIRLGRWPAPDDDASGVRRWKRSTVAAAVAGRRNYRRRPARLPAQ